MSDRNMKDELSEGWVTSSLGVVAEVTMGQSPESRFYNEKGIGLPFFQGKAEFGPVSPRARKWCSEPTKIALPNDILMSVRAPVGPTNIADEKCCIGRGLASIRAKSPVEQNYIHKYLKYLGPWLSEQGTGTTFKAISGDFIRALEVPLAPLAEQKRIADKLESVLGRVDACRARLDRLPALFKRFRQSVLVAATSGRLTEEWRRANDNGGSARRIKIGEESIEVPKDWEEMGLRDLLDPLRPLCYGVVQPGEEVSGGALLIRVQDMEGGNIKVGDLRTISKQVDAEYKRSRIKEGDLLISVVGTIGRTAIVPKNLEANIARAIARLSCRKGVESRWLNYWLSCDTLQWWLLSSSKEVARKTLNLSDLASAPVALPPLSEQQEIVRRVEALFAFADRIESRLAESRKLIDRLTPATLAKAFRGELVPQDPNDEPATALLERLRVQQSTTPIKRTRGRHSKPGKPA